MKNLILDAILFVLFVAELAFHYLPRDIHEILGVAMIILVIVHVAINFRRFIGSFKKISTRKLLSIEVNVALILATLIILFSGLCMSNFIFPDLMSSALRRNMTIHNLHTSAPYIMTILIGMHIALHCHEIKQRLLNYFEAEFSARLKLFSYALIFMLSLFGIVGLFLNRFLDRILMKHIFATPATDLPAWIFILLIVGSVVFFALVTYILVEKIFKRQP